MLKSVTPFMVKTASSAEMTIEASPVKIQRSRSNSSSQSPKSILANVSTKKSPKKSGGQNGADKTTTTTNKGIEQDELAELTTTLTPVAITNNNPNSIKNLSPTPSPTTTPNNNNNNNPTSTISFLNLSSTSTGSSSSYSSQSSFVSAANVNNGGANNNLVNILVTSQPQITSLSSSPPSPPSPPPPPPLPPPTSSITLPPSSENVDDFCLFTLENNTNNKSSTQNLVTTILNGSNSENGGGLLLPLDATTATAAGTIKKVSSSLLQPKEASYKKQKENYETEKKRITNDILTIMRDERIIILADWLKVRGSLKNWIKLYCILKPGIMLLFKSDKPKAGQWVGTLLLTSCQLLERPSKKHGFCFKLFHPLERSIWASKGPAGETYINVPYILLPTFYLIFRAPSENVGQIWMEAIEMAMKSQASSAKGFNESFRSSKQDLLAVSKTSTNNLMGMASFEKRISDTMKSNPETISEMGRGDNNNKLTSLKRQSHEDDDLGSENGKLLNQNNATNNNNNNNNNNSSDEIGSLNSSNQLEDDDDDDDDYQDHDEEYFSNEMSSLTGGEATQEVQSADLSNEKAELGGIGSLDQETRYVSSPKEEFGEGQTEEVGEENKSLIFCLVKQVRPGMDLSKVVLPTFILEPRSFLEKLTDFYYHSDILTEIINNDDPYERMKTVVKFYLSGFYKKPKGLKKPYNPILGEVFRSYWYNSKTDSKTFYIAEQVSHHPPISSFYVTNRKDGFCIYGTVLARSKFYGNSVSAIMDGKVKLILLNRGEEYVISMPYANCKGILIGKLTMELGGKVSIHCAKTGYSAEIEFKLKPLLGGIDASNLIEGKIKFAKETLALLHGKWDNEIILEEKRLLDSQTGTTTPTESVFWAPSQEIIENRLQRFVVPLEDQLEFESEKLWMNVSEAIKISDQNLATQEKTIIETKQREEENERRSKFIEYKSKLFTYDPINKEWLYNYSDLRPWDPQTDMFQYESQFRIFTRTKHKLKVQTRVLDSHDSIIALARSSAARLGHHHHRRIRHHSIVSNVVGESNDYISSNESYDLIVQYNEIKQRLDSIEDYLRQLSKKIETDNKLSTSSAYLRMRHNQQQSSMLETSTTITTTPPSMPISYTKLKINENFNVTLNTKTVLFIIFAWAIGLLSAIITLKLFAKF